jgi:hypothetical protein
LYLFLPNRRAQVGKQAAIRSALWMVNERKRIYRLRSPEKKAPREAGLW